MMQQGYFDDRLKELEQRKKEATASYVTAKLTLQGINKEIDKCFEYMNSAEYNPKQDISPLENEISSLKFTVNRQDKTIQKMNNTLNKKNGQIKSLNKVIKDKDHEISVLQLKHHNEQSKLQEEIAKLNISKNKQLDIKKEEIAVENRELKKENRELKRDNKALHKRVSLMDGTIEKKNNEIRILHERLNWQPVKPRENIFEELLEEAK